MYSVQLPVPPFPLLATVGYTHWQSGITHARRQFDVYDLIICIKGTLYMEEDGILYDVKQGMMLLLEPEKTHSGYRPTDTETEVYWIHFQYPTSLSISLNEKNSSPQPLLQTTDQDTVSHPSTIEIPKFTTVDIRKTVPLLSEMLKLHSVLTLSRSFELQILFCQLLIQLQNGMRKSSPYARAYEIGEKAAAYLADRLEQPFDSKRMESELNYHFDYLARCLKEYSGMSPMQYRHHLQIDRAKRLLAHSTLPLSKIGEQCGFQDMTYFSRLLKRHTTFTPGEYRKKYQWLHTE
ncbi:AraC family transcriptional regulator [Paenibacillus sp. JDR-2]|uniref:AraC family transcriptional regulator n=1 Tax=Paenibacillus sp. (strain JDR-2) TaxID=324057 RepID=UPI0001664823|nr:AraC family transcriptional regulator [Paenibacillus sp. JDR-2]ACT03556.1 transcriptional regulator, AraC family [Paenibacillus sp. JDR-2]